MYVRGKNLPKNSDAFLSEFSDLGVRKQFSDSVLDRSVCLEPIGETRGESSILRRIFEERSLDETRGYGRPQPRRHDLPTATRVVRNHKLFCRRKKGEERGGRMSSVASSHNPTRTTGGNEPPGGDRTRMPFRTIYPVSSSAAFDHDSISRYLEEPLRHEVPRRGRIDRMQIER